MTSFLIGCSSNLQITRTGIKSQTFEFGPVLTVDIIYWGKCCWEDSNFIFDGIFIKLAGNEVSHKILEGFEFLADRTIVMSVTCP